MSNFLSHFLSWLKGIFDSLEKEWHKLEQPVKNALQWASGAVNEITTNLNATPQFLIDLIQSKFPGIDIEKVKAGLTKISADIAGVNTLPADDIETTLKNLQLYFSTLGNDKWEQEASTIAQKLAAFLAPDDTKFATFPTFIEFVYRTLIKK